MHNFGVSAAIKIVDDLVENLSPPVEKEIPYDIWQTDWHEVAPDKICELMLQYENGNIRKNFMIMFDVRDDKKDFPGGNIKTSINVPHRVFRENLGNLINEYYDKVNVIIFCMYSQQRGVRCINWYRQALEELINNYQNPNIKKPIYSKQFYALNDVKLDDQVIDSLKNQKIFIMKGGFNRFFNKYIKNHRSVFENFDQKYWKYKSDHEIGQLVASGKWVHKFDC